MRLAIVIAGLTGGGAERVATTLAAGLAGLGHEVTLMTMDPGDTDFYDVAASVSRVRLGNGAMRSGGWSRLRLEFDLLRRLRRALVAARAEAVIAFTTETSVRAIIAGTGSGARIVATERSDPARHDPGASWRWLRRHVYRFAHAVVVQTVEAGEWITRNTSARHVVVIPNSVAMDEGRGVPMQRNPRPAVAALGRFRPEKGFERLIEAFALAQAAHPGWHLVLGGEGPEEERLRSLVRAHGLEASVRFAGPVTDAGAFLRDADVFALPSHYEGFPNALLEAMACGLPPVSFDSPGPRAIVRHGTDGLLVAPGDIEAFAEALGSLMGDPVRRRALGSAAVEVRSRFSPGRVLPMWTSVLAS